MKSQTALLLTLLTGACLVGIGERTAFAQSADRHDENAGAAAEYGSLANHRFQMPSGEEVLRVLLLRDYNTRMVLASTLLLGITAGTVGTFMLLRKRALVGDVVGHASLPGIAIAFLTLESISPGSGRSLPALLVGALLAGLAGIGCTIAIGRLTRIKEDAALAIVLSVFFGARIALFTVIQNVPEGNAAGLNNFIFGMTALTSRLDLQLGAAATVAVLLAASMLFKEFSLLCFDQAYAAARGWPVLWLDLLLTGLVVSVTVIGLQSVGLLLMVALLIIPPAAARFWSERLGAMTLISGGLGAVSALGGAIVSALTPLPAGPIIVLVVAGCFMFSMLLGRRRGLIPRLLSQRHARRQVGRLDLMRACFEQVEPKLNSSELDELVEHSITRESLLRQRTWTARRVDHLLATAVRDGLLSPVDDGYRLTADGARAAARAARNHRLWELYLVNYADVATSVVDRHADRIEHVLEPAVIAELELLLMRHDSRRRMPASLHPIEEDEATNAAPADSVSSSPRS